MDCDRITKNLIVGSCLLDVNEVEELRSLGITAILSLQTEDDMGKRGTDWQENAATGAKLKFKSVPVRDFDSEDLRRKLPECVMALDRMLKAGHTVYLHCTAGQGRSPTVAAAYLHWCLAWPLERALAHVRNARDCSPSDSGGDQEKIEQARAREEERSQLARFAGVSAGTVRESFGQVNYPNSVQVRLLGASEREQAISEKAFISGPPGLV